MKNILVLGAGLVSRPGVHYLLGHKDFRITVASRTLHKAEALVKGYQNGIAISLDINNTAKLVELIKGNDIVISLLPWIHHVKVAEHCLAQNTHMTTTSYVSKEMQVFDSEAKNKGLLFLNEIGVDPGIDHMSAMKIIDQVHSEGGKILHFYSYCGGLPAPEDNDNPFGYKFSWSPKGVVLASRNSAHYLENGENIIIEGKNLFVNPRLEEVDELGNFEVYPNRDSLPYKNLYGLHDALTVMRGTYRNIGWCATLKAIVDLGLVDETPIIKVKGMTFQQLLAELVGASESDNIRVKTAEILNIEIASPILDRLEWLGLFSDESVTNHDNLLDILSDRLQEKLFYKEGEKDMILLQHKFTVENKKKMKEFITSTLIDYGIPKGDSSMARTVSLPLAIGVKLILTGKITLTGIQIPIMKEIYDPVLNELESMGIKMVEKISPKNSH